MAFTGSKVIRVQELLGFVIIRLILDIGYLVQNLKTLALAIPEI